MKSFFFNTPDSSDSKNSSFSNSLFIKITTSNWKLLVKSSLFRKKTPSLIRNVSFTTKKYNYVPFGRQFMFSLTNENTRRGHTHKEKKSMLKHSTQSFVAFDGLKENADVIISHSLSFTVKKRPRGSTADMLGFICSLQPDNCRSTTVPHSTHSRISQQALQASLNKSRSSLGEKFTQTSDWGLLFFSCSHINIRVFVKLYSAAQKQ